MQGQTFRKLAGLLVALSWLAQSFILAHPVKASTPSTAAQQLYPCDESLLLFDEPNQGWVVEAKSPSYAKMTSKPYPPDSPVGIKSTGLELNLEGTLKKVNDWAQFKIDLNRTKPRCAQALSLNDRWWTEGSVLSLWVWAPEGTRGDNGYANGLRLYLVDDQGKKYYGTWHTFQEGTWFEVTFKLDRNAPSPVCIFREADFNFDKIRTLGLNISLNSDRPTPIIHKTLWISPLQIKSGVLTTPASNHMYSFDAETNELPQWSIITDPAWGAEAFTDTQIRDGALVIGTDFRKGVEPHRKGVIDLVYAPALHLRDANPLNTYISLDIKFDPPPDLTQANCPFLLLLWAFDNGQKIQFNSINQVVGSGDWTRVGFRLGDLAPSGDGVDPSARLDPSQIEKIGFQIYFGEDKYDYQGRILIDNIAIGGSVQLEPPPDIKPVIRNGSHFMMDGSRFRFIGANAEYLPYKPEDVTIQVLDRAKALGIGVIRTWGFGEGCEDYSLADCEEVSPYFQPQAGLYNKSAFEHFDRIVYEAGLRNIHLIVPLANNWAEYGGIPRYVCWQTPTRNPSDCNVRQMTYKDHDRFYTDPAIREQYRNYVKYFVTHRNTITGKTYAEDPTIMAWELINEPRSQSNPSGENLHAWIKEMSDYLAGLAPNQLIGIGEEGWYIKSQTQAYEFKTWQGYDKSYKNYWHYGVNWLSTGCIDDWGSNGTDFLSDNSTDPFTVEWQAWAGEEISAPVQRAERPGVKEVDFTGIHLYLAPEETGLSYAPYCYYQGLDSLCSSNFDTTQSKDLKDVHQAREWVKQHVENAHTDLQKPFILEEFNFPVPWQNPSVGRANPNGNQFEVTPDERARLFEQYLDFAYDLDVDGVMFWNLGYDGFMQQPWDEIDALKDWKADLDGFLSKDTSDGIRFYYSPWDKENFIELTNPRVDWLRAEGYHVLMDLFNDGDAQEVNVEVELAGNSLPRSQTFQIVQGENQILLDELFAPVQKLESSITCPLPKEEHPLVTRITIRLQKMTSFGSALFNFHTFFNDKYVIYPDDPVEAVVYAASQRWAQVSEPVVAPKVTISPALTCGKDIHVTQTTLPLQIVFDMQGSIDHPDGYYYRYSIAAPRGQYELNFGSLGQAKTDHISVNVNAIGKYEVKIAPEGESLDGKSAGACAFEVVNTPIFDVMSVEIDNEEVQPSVDLYTPVVSLATWERAISISIADKVDASKQVKVGCQLLTRNAIVESPLLNCQKAPVVTVRALGLSDLIQGNLPPGRYELRLWSESEEFGRSEPTIIYFNIPNPLHYGSALVLVLLVAAVGLWQRAKLRAMLSRFSSRKSEAIDSK